MKIKLAFVSNIASGQLNNYLKEYDCTHFEINNVVQTLTGKVNADYLLVILDINYFAFDGFLNTKSIEKFEELLQLLKLFRKNNDSKVIVSNLASDYLDINTSNNLEQFQKLLSINLSINRLAEISDVSILNLYHLTFKYGFNNLFNLKNGFLFQAPFTKLACKVIGQSIEEKIKLFNTPRKKLLLIDADNTLWGGIIGEDGIDNIDIDQNYPGVIYRHFQKHLKYLQQTGLLLAIVSKNEYDDVKQVFERRNMPLKWNDFILKKINWKPKSQNIQEIVDELNIGLNSVIFLDDSLFEIAEVKDALDIDTIKISKGDPFKNIMNLNSELSLKTMNVTEEDKKKHDLYKTQNKRIQHKTHSLSIEDYLTSLDMILSISINDISKVKRITQLINKTNQFNLTTKRYSESDVTRLIQEHTVYSFNLLDKFGDLGLIAVVIIINGNIDNFLISCRALGRNLEYKILFLITNSSKDNLISQYIETAKNKQVIDFYDKFSIKTIRNENITTYHLSKDNIFDVAYIKVMK